MSDMNQLTDEELMKEYQSGNEMAFTILYKRHSAKIYGFLIGRLRERAFADDVFQATFLKLHKTRANYDATLPFMPWLFTVCRSVMIDSLRKKKHILEDSDSDSVDLARAPEIPDHTPLPSLDGLPANQRQVLELRYRSDLSFEEIAKKLETTPLNVRQITSRAVRRLRSWVEKDKE
ncbi:MAG: sigma-70 family RNA polymerase sigma factor [Bdellovibrionia bacterium]